MFFFFQAEDGIRDRNVTGVQTCALPILMKSHGAVTVGKDIVEAFVLANYLEENAYRQYMALQIGKPYVFSEQEIMLCREKLWTPNLFKRTWDHFRAKLPPLE